MQPKIIALATVILPLIALNGSYLWSAVAGEVPWCVPYWDGCVSVSRAARSGNSIFLFRAIMLPFAAVLLAYWLLAYRWLRLLGDLRSVRPLLMLLCGAVGVLFLILYVDFLGSSGSFYYLMRRVGVVHFFTFSAFAGLILVSRLYHLSSSKLLDHLVVVRRFKLFICLAQIGLATANIAVALLLENRDAANNIIEWNAALLLTLFALGTYVAWLRTGFAVRYYAG